MTTFTHTLIFAELNGYEADAMFEVDTDDGRVDLIWADIGGFRASEYQARIIEGHAGYDGAIQAVATWWATEGYLQHEENPDDEYDRDEERPE